ncbi:phosphotransferase [Nocardia sp. NPDC057663]|uniref:phosphotransferase n=1 Tax=Nocardia sp. NPDC057663 TaxID=3346201 RepID=UPI00366D930C
MTRPGNLSTLSSISSPVVRVMPNGFSYGGLHPDRALGGTMSPQLSAGPVTDLGTLSPEAATEILRRHHDLPGYVTEVTAQPFGTGQVANCSRLTLSFTGDRGDAPDSLIGKFASDDANSRGVAAATGLYARELGFYRELAPGLAVRTPQLYHADASENGSFALLLEDVAPAQVIDQLDGCGPEHAELAIREAAALHSSSWGRDELQNLPWLQSFQPILQATVEALPGFHAQFRSTYSDLIDSSVLEVADDLVEAMPSWIRLASPGYALWHHDFRPDNLLFDANNGADPLVVVDWQTVSYGPAIADVSYFLGCGLTVEDRRAHERELVAIYHDALTDAGVRGPSREECWQAYLDHAVTAMFMAVHASVRVERTERGDAMWASWLERAAAQLTDHDILSRY